MTISGLASEMLEPLQSCVLHNKQDNQQTSRLSYQEYSNNISLVDLGLDFFYINGSMPYGVLGQRCMSLKMSSLPVKLYLNTNTICQMVTKLWPIFNVFLEEWRLRRQIK